MDGTASTPNATTSNKRPRRSLSSANHGGTMSPGGVINASKRPRIILKVHSTLQAKSNGPTADPSRKQLPREEQELLREVDLAKSPRPGSYAGIGKGLPSKCAKPQPIKYDRLPTVSHLIKRLEEMDRMDREEYTVSDSEEEEPVVLASTGSEPNPDGAEAPVPMAAPEEQGAENKPADAKEAVDSSDDSSDMYARDDNESPESSEEGGKNDDVDECEGSSDDESDWIDEATTAEGSSDLYTVEDESLGYITSEDECSLTEVVQQAVVEATLEGLGAEDPDLPTADRARKRIILRNTSLRELRRLERKRMVDETDIGTVVLDRLDQDLQRIGMNATSLLRLMEVTDTIASGSFLLPLMDRKFCIPNDLDLYAGLDSYEMVLSYLKKKGFSDLKRIYPNGRRVATYGCNLRDVSFIYELRNKKTYKVNVIVSRGRPILPIFQFHSTPVMNYLSFHGLVCLYDITLYKLGVANYPAEDAPKRVQTCYAKYKDRGFQIWGHLEEEHTCKLDACCPQTIRSLFDKDVLHIRFPDHLETSPTELRRNEAKIAIWRLSTGAACNAMTEDTAGFAICDSEYTHVNLKARVGGQARA
ncbi:hypothetical protein MD484_g7830, partial [Candolleomyces efflorescens]